MCYSRSSLSPPPGETTLHRCVNAVQMLLKVAVAAALVAVPLAVNATCGDLKWPCCDIPDNDPNGGTCRDDTLLTCWEGACKRCGTDGMPACAGATFAPCLCS